MKQKNKIIQFLPSAVFCMIILLIPVLYLAIPDSDFSALEKRKLSQFPKPTLDTVFSGEFGKDFETYLNDQMPLRTFFVGTNAYYDQLVGRNGLNGIYRAKDDYLMVTPVKDVPTLDNNLKYIGEFVDTMDVPSYVCVVPTAGYIYNDELPLNHYEYNDDELIDKIENSFSKYPRTTFVNIVDDFKELSKSEQLYYRTDHHWTSEGAYECYKLLGNAMGFEPTAEDNFEKEVYNGFYGTNYSKSALWFTPGETLEIWDNTKRPQGSIEMYITEGGEVSVSDKLFYRENLDTTDQYTAFLDGNHALVTIKNSNAKSDKKLLVLRDSYSHCLAPFLADNYSEIVLADVRYYLNPVSDIVKNENIDEILLMYSLDSIVNSTDLGGIY